MQWKKEHVEVSEPVVEKRKIFWIIDIFLYPLTASGIVVLAIFIFTPFAFELARGWLNSFEFEIFLWLINKISYFALFVLMAYIFWYVGECIHESAIGHIRAPMPFGRSELVGVFDMIRRMVYIVICGAVYLGPGLAYYWYYRKTDSVFLALIGAGSFLFPMSLINVIMSYSLTPLNPLMVIKYVLKTLHWYVPTVFLCAAIIAAAVWARINYPPQGRWQEKLVWAAGLYLLLVIAHILGCFYNRSSKKLS